MLRVQDLSAQLRLSIMRCFHRWSVGSKPQRAAALAARAAPIAAHLASTAIARAWRTYVYFACDYPADQFVATYEAITTTAAGVGYSFGSDYEEFFSSHSYQGAVRWLRLIRRCCLAVVHSPADIAVNSGHGPAAELLTPDTEPLRSLGDKEGGCSEPSATPAKKEGESLSTPANKEGGQASHISSVSLFPLPGSPRLGDTPVTLPPGLGLESPFPSSAHEAQSSPGEMSNGPHQTLSRLASPLRFHMVLQRRQSRRSAEHAWLRTLQGEAISRLRAVPQRTWIVMTFAYQLQRRAWNSSAAVDRRASVAARARVMKLISAAPRPMAGYDVAYDEHTATFSFRSCTGEMSTSHPSCEPGHTVPAYTSAGHVTQPLWPPPTSSWVLVPEASGAWCYLDTASGCASWHAPGGSMAPSQRQLTTAPMPFREPPPLLDDRVTFGTLERAGWLPIYLDTSHSILLRHELTGATRSAPWVSLRTMCGVIYFANLVTRQTRWFPPHLWMEGWVRRKLWMRACSQQDVDETAWDNTVYSRRALPLHVGRLRVEGGAPYLHSYGEPAYPSDDYDTPETYPMSDEQAT